MSISQEEIEALMNGLDIIEDKSETEAIDIEEPVKVDTKEIEELISQAKNIEGIEEKNIVSPNTDEIENLLKDIESTNVFDDKKKIKDLQSNMSLDGFSKHKNKISGDDILKNWTSSAINEGIIPTPAQSDTKVVSQLTQVANDSKEKVSKTFDVLSLALDNNRIIRDNFKDYEKSLSSQALLLNNLSQKFPNIKVFSEHLDNINKISLSIKNLNNVLNDEDNSIFQAIELMQFNDINRQKIERVKFIIRKLSLYLNNLFEDNDDPKFTPATEHIHGDSKNDLAGNDLDKLIEEFLKNS